MTDTPNVSCTPVVSEALFLFATAGLKRLLLSSASVPLAPSSSVRGARGPQRSLLLLRDHLLGVGRQVQPQWPLPAHQRLPDRQSVGPQHGEQTPGDVPGVCPTRLRRPFANQSFTGAQLLRCFPTWGKHGAACEVLLAVCSRFNHQRLDCCCFFLILIFISLHKDDA